MLARDYSEKLTDIIKPVIVSHHMLMGMKEGQDKMSKSDPDSAIFMEDTRETVEAKIKKSFCAPQIVEENPILDYCRHIIMPALGVLKISRKDGGSKTYTTYAELEADFVSGECHPGDLKPAVAGAINDLL